MPELELPTLPATLSRAELHALVWQIPMMHLAEHFGLSGNGLAKTCNRMEVPVPPRGYWAKKAAGRQGPVAALPPKPSGVASSVTFSKVQKETDGAASPRRVAEDLAATIQVHVNQRLTKPHRLVASWLDDRERREQEAKRERDPWRRDLYMPPPLTDQDRRMHRIFDALFKFLDHRGASVRQSDRKALLVKVDGQEIEIGLREKLTQVRRPLTKKELEWETWNKSGTKTELQGTGFLVFSIKSYLVGDLKREWLEKEGKPLEAMLPLVVATLLVAGQLLSERAKRQAEEAERLAIEQRRREEERLQQKQDQNRVRRLVEISKAWRDLEIAREFLLALEQGPHDPAAVIGDKSIAEWIEWARQQIHQGDPCSRGPTAVFSDLSKVTSWTYRD